MSLHTETYPITTALAADAQLVNVHGFCWDAADPENTYSPSATQLWGLIEFEDGSHERIRVRPLAWVSTRKRMNKVRLYGLGTGNVVITAGSDPEDKVIPSPFDQPPPAVMTVLYDQTLSLAAHNTGSLVVPAGTSALVATMRGGGGNMAGAQWYEGLPGGGLGTVQQPWNMGDGHHSVWGLGSTVPSGYQDTSIAFPPPPIVAFTLASAGIAAAIRITVKAYP